MEMKAIYIIYFTITGKLLTTIVFCPCFTLRQKLSRIPFISVAVFYKNPL